LGVSTNNRNRINRSAKERQVPNDRKFNQKQKQNPNRHCSNRSTSRAQTHEPLIRQQFHAKTQIMNPVLFGLVIIASQFLLALALLFTAGSLIRIDLNQAEAADSRLAKIPSRFIRDLRALKDALVEFFARSNESRRILSVLLARRKPLRLSAIAQEVQLETDRRREPYVLPMSIAWAILWILQVSGLVRMSLHGFLITEVGREVYRRIEGSSTISAEG
jgi:hypothetical protein